MATVPLSGTSWPTIMRRSVVLPVPFGPMTPTREPGGMTPEKPSSNTVSPKALLTPSKSITTSPSRGPAGM